MKNIGKIYLLILTILLIGPLISKANPVKILYVSAENQTGPVYDKINELITEELRACLQEKFTQKINSITWESMNPKSKLIARHATKLCFAVKSASGYQRHRKTDPDLV